MKKKYNVIAYQSTRYEMEVEADSEAEAVTIASTHTVVSNAWSNDSDYYSFSVSNAEEIEDE